jgi:hypothetical protein
MRSWPTARPWWCAPSSGEPHSRSPRPAARPSGGACPSFPPLRPPSPLPGLRTRGVSVAAREGLPGLRAGGRWRGDGNGRWAGRCPNPLENRGGAGAGSASLGSGRLPNLLAPLHREIGHAVVALDAGGLPLCSGNPERPGPGHPAIGGHCPGLRPRRLGLPEAGPLAWPVRGMPGVERPAMYWLPPPVSAGAGFPAIDRADSIGLRVGGSLSAG